MSETCPRLPPSAVLGRKGMFFAQRHSVRAGNRPNHMLYAIYARFTTVPAVAHPSTHLHLDIFLGFRLDIQSRARQDFFNRL